MSKPNRSNPLALRVVRGAMGTLSRLAPEAAAAIAEHLMLTPRRRRWPQQELDVLATARRFQLHTPRGDLAAWRWGDAKAPAVLLVHGWEGRGAQLGGFVAPLLECDQSVVTFDAPAHGNNDGRRSSAVHFADAIESAAAALWPLRAIVTHSMGGLATLWASRDHALAPRLVLISPPNDLLVTATALADTLGLTDDARQRVQRRLYSHVGIAIDAIRAEPIATQLRGRLLVIHDEDDREVPFACGEAIARAKPGSELMRTRGLGHRRILRDPAVVQRVVDFVCDVAVATSTSAS